MHLDKPFVNSTDIWFSSSGKINGTGARNWISKNNINENTQKIVLTDDLILGNLVKDMLNVPTISFSGIANSYQVLKAIDNTDIKDIIFTIRLSHNQNLDYIIHRVFKDLIPLGYNLETKVIRNYKDLLEEDFLDVYKLEKVSV